MKKDDGICVYHSADMDGICSGAIFRKWKPGIELLGYDYGREFPWERVVGRDVYMVDVSLPLGDMVRLGRESKTFTWIDHHVGIIKETEGSEEFRAAGIREVGRAGCELTWEYLYGGEVPLAVKLLGRYDVWDHVDERVLPFQYGMRMKIKGGVSDPQWFPLFETERVGEMVISELLCEKIMETGRLLLEYQSGENAKYVRAYAFESELDGLRMLVCNVGMQQSLIFECMWDNTRYDAMGLFVLRKNGTWKVSLYTDREDVDLCVVAQAHGGGGHRKAAGFISKEVPFKPLVKNGGG